MELIELKSIVLEQKSEQQSHAKGVPRQLLAQVFKYYDTPHAVILSGMRRELWPKVVFESLGGTSFIN